MTRRVIISSGCDEAYYPKMRAYMESVERNGGQEVGCYLVGVGWQPPSERGFTGVRLPLAMARGGGEISCVQYGGFVHAIPGREDDVIVFTDGGDVVMQRGFDADEWETLTTLPEGTVWVGLNAGPEDTLRQEAKRLVPRRRIPGKYPGSMRVYNTGVIAARKSTFRELELRYMENWREVDLLFLHYAKIQWLISWVIGTHLRAEVMPRTFHGHGHFGLDGYSLGEGGNVYFGRREVLFRHRIDPERLRNAD